MSLPSTWGVAEGTWSAEFTYNALSGFFCTCTEAEQWSQAWAIIILAGFSQEPQSTHPRVRFLKARGMHCKAAQICCLLSLGRGNFLGRKICQIPQAVQVFAVRVPSLFLLQHLISWPQLREVDTEITYRRLVPKSPSSALGHCIRCVFQNSWS